MVTSNDKTWKWSKKEEKQKTSERERKNDSEKRFAHQMKTNFK